jgi:hypothetical protein
VHLVGFTIDIYYDARSYKRQICNKYSLFGSKHNGMAHIKIASKHAASQVIFHSLWNASRQELAAATRYTPVESSPHSADQFV